MKLTDITFFVNRYDRDGDVCEYGIFLYFENDVSIKVGD